MHPTVEVEVIGLKKTVKINALIDTGFSGFLCIPFKHAKEVGLVLLGEEKYELANGQWITQYFFQGKVRFLGVTQEVEMLVSDSETAQIGILLLADCRLSIDFPSNKIKVTRKNK